MNQNFEKKLKFLRLDGDQAVFSDPDGAEVRWLAADLPPAALGADGLCLKIISAETEEVERNRLAAAMLNELLKSSSAAE
ncbi:hypothetical protein EPN90_04495 [Patescibacteria group bacterium]|nr:MAG: hypothetical protein EPN90_04495 [Patescibacteria group bacterium]